MAPQYLLFVIVRGETGHEFQLPARGAVTVQRARRRPGRELRAGVKPERDPGCRVRPVEIDAEATDRARRRGALCERPRTAHRDGVGAGLDRVTAYEPAGPRRRRAGEHGDGDGAREHDAAGCGPEMTTRRQVAAEHGEPPEFRVTPEPVSSADPLDQPAT